MVALGYLLPTRERTMRGLPATAPLLDLAERAESDGFASIWVGDSILAKPRHEPLTLLAAVAARTTKAMLGTAVFLPAMRHPVVLAHMGATVDLLSEGRLILGIGMAADTPKNRSEFEATGVPFERRGARMVETIDVCRALWSGEPLDHQGLFPLEQAQLLPTPHRSGGPLIWAAGEGPVGRRRAAERYDGWFPIGADRSRFVDGVAEVRGLAETAGRAAPTVAMYLTISIDHDRSRADETLEDYLAEYYSAPGAAVRAMQACAAGSVDDVLSEVEAWGEAGADHIVIRFAGDADAHFEAIAPLLSV